MIQWSRSRAAGVSGEKKNAARLGELRRRLRRVVAPLNRLVPFFPRLEIAEHDDAHVVVLDLPGVRKEDISIRLDGYQTLTVSGERRDRSATQARRRSYSERRYGAFSRTIDLPISVDGWRMNAVLQDGVLEIRLPRLDTGRNRTRTVPIEVVVDDPQASVATFPTNLRE
jgi:HSP20 family protein